MMDNEGRQLTQEEFLALGAWALEHYSSPFQVDGRTATNTEMMAMRAYKQRQRAAQMKRDGKCCDEGPVEGGHCRYGGGMCPLFMDAKELLKRHERQGRDE